jgi:hypothetical protein
LLRRFVCAQCGATGPVDSPAPYQRCDSCQAVGDFDWGAARRHADWPAHEALLHDLLAKHHHALDQARVDANRRGWIAIYTGFLEQLIARFPALYPPRAGETDYRARFVAFHTTFLMAMAIEPPLLDGELELDGLRQRVRYQNELAHPETLWPLVDASLRYFAIQEQLGYAVPPPEDFAPRYVFRSAVSAFVADWLPRLAPKVQRQLVDRLGVSAEYLEPRRKTREVACRTCGGAIPVADDTVTTTCPYCGADLHAAEAGKTARAEGLAMLAEAERCLKAALRDGNSAHAPVQVIEILDGMVERAGKPYRMVTLRAAGGPSPTGSPRRDAFFVMHDDPASPSFAEIYGWLDHVARERQLPHRTLAYREHPSCNAPAKTAGELAQRLAQAAPNRDKRDVVLTIYGRGVAAELDDGDGVVRIALAAEGGAPMGTIKKWLRSG